MAAVGFTPSGPEVAEDIRDLQSGALHGCARLLRWVLDVKRSSGIATWSAYPNSRGTLRKSQCGGCYRCAFRTLRSPGLEVRLLIPSSSSQGISHSVNCALPLAQR